MTEQEVVTLMKSSNTAQEWDANCGKVKHACGGYPSFWWPTIIVSGLGDQVAAKWGGDMQIRIVGISIPTK
jgi:hypothetical protein